VKASVFRRWPVIAPFRGEQTTRLTGGYDYRFSEKFTHRLNRLQATGYCFSFYNRLLYNQADQQLNTR